MAQGAMLANEQPMIGVAIWGRGYAQTAPGESSSPRRVRFRKPAPCATRRWVASEGDTAARSPVCETVTSSTLHEELLAPLLSPAWDNAITAAADLALRWDNPTVVADRFVRDGDTGS